MCIIVYMGQKIVVAEVLPKQNPKPKPNLTNTNPSNAIAFTRKISLYENKLNVFS